MAEIYKIIPVEERPYEWAKAEMDMYFSNPKRIQVTHLEDMVERPGVHISIFHKNDHSVDIWRVYWKDSNSFKYDILVNYQELKRDYPDIVAKLERNGVEAYEERLKKAAPDYKPASPVKSPEEYEAERITEELYELKMHKRMEIAERLKFARRLGDLSENPTYDAVKQEQREVEDRIEELSKRLREITGYGK